MEPYHVPLTKFGNTALLNLRFLLQSGHKISRRSYRDSDGCYCPLAYCWLIDNPNKTFDDALAYFTEHYESVRLFNEWLESKFYSQRQLLNVVETILLYRGIELQPAHSR